MALPPLASVSDLAAWVGGDIPDGDARAGAVLSHASTKVRTYVGKTWVDEAGELKDVPDVAAQVAVRVAGRAWMNPEDLDSVTLDDGTKRWGSVRGIALTEEDKADLASLRDTASFPAGLGVVGTYRGDGDYIDTIYVPTAPQPSGDPFPWYAADDPLAR